MEHTSSIATNNNWCYQSFFIDTDFIHLYLYTIIVALFYWNGTKFEISVVIIPYSEIKNFVPFSNIQ